MTRPSPKHEWICVRSDQTAIYWVIQIKPCFEHSVTTRASNPINKYHIWRWVCLIQTQSEDSDIMHCNSAFKKLSCFFLAPYSVHQKKVYSLVKLSTQNWGGADGKYGLHHTHHWAGPSQWESLTFTIFSERLPQTFCPFVAISWNFKMILV